MATTKKTAPAAKTTSAKPAAKAAPATKSTAKVAAAPAAKPAAKKAAAKPATPEIVVGSVVRFLGYDESVPDDQRILEDGVELSVHDIADDGEGNTLLVVRIPNPDFNSKKKEDATSNPREIETELFLSEVELVEAEQAAEQAEEQAPVEEAPKATRGKKAAKTPEPVQEAQPEEQTEEDGLPDLDTEDAEVAALVNESDDLVALAQQLEGDIGSTEYKLGGILYHIKKAGAYKEMDDGAYAEKGGFALFLGAYMNIEYRKAMYLIDIYVYFNQAGIENASETVARLGWTKASKIAKLMMVEGNNPVELIELAESSTVKELSEAISTQNVAVGGTKGELKKRTTLKFSYFEDEAEGVTEALKIAQEQHGLQKPEDALLLIVNEWLAAAGGGEAATQEQAPAQSAPVGKARAAAKPAVKKAAAKA